MKALTVITTNDGKFREFTDALSVSDIRIQRLNARYPEIQADSLEEVVVFGMQWLNGKADPPFVIDDSGLFIEGLKGFPGVYSSHAYRTVGNDGILKLMEGISDRKAVFMTVIGLFSNGKARTFKGACHGNIAYAARGNGGFGFDPIFCPAGSSRTFAEFSVSEKNEISHRGIALRKLKQTLIRDNEEQA